MSEPGTSSSIKRQKLKRRDKKGETISLSSSSSNSSESEDVCRKSRSAVRSHNKKKRVRSISTSSSSTSSSDLSRSSIQKRKTKSTDSVLRKLIAVINSRNRAPHGFSGQNLLPAFDPQAKAQSMKDWLCKINETAAVYEWSEKQTIYSALPRLTGLAKRWYDGLTSVKFSWSEWQKKLLKAFPCEENYGDLLTEMLNRKSKCDETLEEYYYDKIRLINRCELRGLKAVDCLILGVYDQNIRMNAQGLCFKKPDDVLTYFRKLSVKHEDFQSIQVRKMSSSDQVMTMPLGRTQVGSATEEKQMRKDLSCFNCKEKGHFWNDCPQDLLKCDSCKRIGHKTDECVRNK